MQYCGNTGGSNTAAFASSCGDAVAIARESDGNGVVAANIAEGPAVLNCHWSIVHCKCGDIIALFRRDGVALAATAQHLGRISRRDAAALACRSHDAIAIALESGRKGMVCQYLMEEIYSSCIILIV